MSLIGGLIGVFLLVPGSFSATGVTPLRALLGWGAYAVVAVLVLGGVALAFASKMGWRVRWAAVLAGELLLLLLLAASHLGRADPLGDAQAGYGGGIVGWAISQFLLTFVPTPVAWALLILSVVTSAWLLWRALPVEWTSPVSAAWHRAVRGAPAVSDLLPTRPPRFYKPREPREVLGLRSWLTQAWDGLLPALKVIVASLAIGGPAEEKEEGEEALPRARRIRSRAGSGEPGETAAQPSKSSVPPKTESRSGRSRSRSRSLPPLSLLRPDSGHAGSNADVRQRSQIIKQTLAEFGVPVEIVSIKEGPTVTQYGLEPGEIVKELRDGQLQRRRVSVASIMRLTNDLALALAAPSLRMEAPVPGRPYLGIEIPNSAKTLVSLRNVLESKEFTKVGSPLGIGLGRDVSGDPVVADLTRMPHLLIAGATGSGKSVCINGIICSLLMNNTPQTVQLLLVDPKMVELPVYNGVPHLVGRVITDAEQVAGALAWLTLQMDERYRSFAGERVRNIVEYNRKVARSRQGEPLPYIVLVIDELADLMLSAPELIERQICRLAQMSRATGIHLVLATQRPSVDVITGLIKANFPARIAFAVTSQVDSRVVLDTPGAEKLLGRGDMLFMAPDSAKLSRIQGCFVADEEIEGLVDFWKKARGEEQADAPAVIPWAALLDQMEDRDDMLERAIRFARTRKQVSTSLLQRQLRIGFPRAARLMEQLEEMGVVGPDEGGGRSREVLFQEETARDEST